MMVPVMEHTMQIFFFKNDSTVVVRNTRAKGQIQNIITYKMKKLIEQKLIRERKGECSTHAPNGTLDAVIWC